MAIYRLKNKNDCQNKDLLKITHPAKTDLNKKWLPKQKTIQNFNIDALGFIKTRNENPPTQEIGLIGNPCWLICPWLAVQPARVSW